MSGPSIARITHALAAVVCAGGVAVLTYPRWRPWCLTWGASTEEAAMTLPGDELLEDPDVVTTGGRHRRGTVSGLAVDRPDGPGPCRGLYL